MDWLRKNLNLKLYLILSIITIVIIELIFARSKEVGLIYLSIWVASLLNQLMLVMGLGVLLKFKDQKPPLTEMAKAASLMLGKTLILGIAFYIGVLFIRNKIIIALFIYIVQLANLFLSIKRK